MSYKSMMRNTMYINLENSVSRYILVSFFVVLFSFLFVSFAFAADVIGFGDWAGIVDATGNSALWLAGTSWSPWEFWAQWILDSIKWIVNRVLWISWFIAVVFVIRWWFRMLTAAGNDEQYNWWFTIIKNAWLWIVYISVAWFIVSFLFWIAWRIWTA